MSNVNSISWWEEFYEQRSFILHPENAFDAKGRPTTSNSFTFQSEKDLLKSILTKRTDEWGNPVGSLETCKGDLRAAKEKWRYYCTVSKVGKIDPKSPPTGQIAEKINRLTARKAVLEKECRALNKGLAEKEGVENAGLQKKQKKMAFKGLCKLCDGVVARCDWREVRDGKFVDDGSDLDQYLTECRRRKLAHAKALSKVQRQKTEAIKREKKEKLEREQAQINKETSKILKRRKKEAA